MRVLVDWLEAFVAVPDRIDRLADRLTAIGLEVEDTRVPSEALDGLRAAVPRRIRRHETNPELTVCELETPAGSVRVVTAADNLREKSTYVWAAPDARLPDGRVKKRSFDGVESEGMLCSLQDLGLASHSRRLLELPGEVDRTTPIVELLKLNRPVLELDLTPNRADCLSHLGVARDFAAAESLPLESPGDDTLPEGPAADGSVAIEDETGCGVYVGMPVHGLTVGPSPLEWQVKLIRLGQSPVNNIVDATNLVLFERGHPLHAFDEDRLSYPVTVRRAQPEETLRTLDGEARTLTAEDLVIADAEAPRALAGIMGGEATEVTPDTTRILLEGAHFDPVRIRRTASRLDLSTEASHRFERGTDPEGIDASLARCLDLLREDPRQDPDAMRAHRPHREHKRESSPVRIAFSPDRFETLIGYQPGEQVMRQRLERLGCEVDEDGDGWAVTSPSWRHDLTRPQDLMEEIVRLDGYRNIPSDYPRIALNETPTPEEQPPERARAILSDLGFREAITFSFVAPEQHRFASDAEPHSLRNPLSRRQSTLRRSLLDGLTESLGHDLDAGREDVRLFEVGRTFPPDRDEEPRRVGMVATGKTYRERWDEHTRPFDFFDLRGAVELLLERLGHRAIRLEPASFPGFRDHRGGRLHVADAAVGRLGEIDADALELDVDAPVLGAEIELSALPDVPPPRYRPFSDQPVVKRDLDLVVDREQHAAPLRTAIREAADWLESTELFDLYYGDPLPEGKKSLSFRLRFRRSGETLSDEEINRVQETILERLREKFDATLREE